MLPNSRLVGMALFAHPREQSNMESDKTFKHDPINTATQTAYFLELLIGSILRHASLDAIRHAGIFKNLGSLISAWNVEDEMVL